MPVTRAHGTVMVLVALCTTMIGCERERTRTGTTVTDSAGVEIVTSVEPAWAPDEGWTIAPEPELVIGDRDDPSHALDRVQGVARLDDGRIAVLDGGSSTVRLYDTDGSHLVDIGGPGDGPAEFAGAQHVAAIGGEVVVYERLQPATLTRFAPDGTHLGTERLAAPAGQALYGYAVGMDGRDATVVVAATAERPAASAVPVRQVLGLWRLAPDSAGTRRLAGVPQKPATLIPIDDSRARTTDVVFGPDTYTAAADGRAYVADAAAWSIDVRDMDGALRRIVRRDAPPVTVTDAHLDRLAEQQIEVAGAAPELVPTLRQRLGEGPVAEVMPAFRMIVVDATGHLWVEEWDDVGIRQGGFSVFDPEGVWLGRVDLPPGLPRARGFNRTLVIHHDVVIGVWEGELGVQTVRIYPIRKP